MKLEASDKLVDSDRLRSRPNFLKLSTAHWIDFFNGGAPSSTRWLVHLSAPTRSQNSTINTVTIQNYLQVLPNALST